ncbi:hypothetical protein [Gillisia hiemivivida]|uniref:TonB C-terminal domain-containing protein n=1 Tax=Gillisia hiemivivida TaxID=291190 RepID=A0A5C6ZNX6_9FLAO|nr:hypothetical protein [Gillisia hiemivivida]TXD91745.1 hypothetical protein ES724_16045 [Gillisia hiemivivida]
MRKILLLLIFPFLVCCKNFETKKISSEEVFNQETQSLNWKEVDEYPAFENCKNITELEKARDCFESTVANSIYAYLVKQQPIVTQSIDDTLFLYLEISKSGKPVVDSIRVDSVVTYQLPELDKWVRQSVDSLPKIYPAIKRGIPVSSVFKMPIIIKAE